VWKEMDLGLSNFHNRWEDPALGRFLSVDKESSDPDQVDKSPYAVFWNNPLKYDDPDGNCPRCIKAIAKTAIKSVAKGKVDLGEIYDAVEAVKTIVDPSASLVTKAVAVFDLVSPVSSKEIKAVSKIVDGAGDAKKAQKLIGPARDAGAAVTKQVPSNYTMKTTKKNDATHFVDPENPKANNVRVMQGKPNSPNKSQQTEHVKHTKNGKVVDKHGKPSDREAQEAHIKKEEFKF
jgi:RHS repeat-associated protein